MTPRMRLAFFAADAFRVVVALNRRFRDSETPFGRVAALILGGFVLALTRLQLVRRAWRRFWWRLAGMFNRRWRCEVCGERTAPRVARDYCRTCAENGLDG